MNPSFSAVPVLASLAGVWWLLTDGAAESWLIGIPATLAAAWSYRRPEQREGSLSWVGAARFLPFFLWESLRGGVDVAQRTLAPRMRISPGFAVYRCRLQKSGALVLFANCVSLLPGTLTADLEGDRLRLHLLDSGADVNRELDRLERAVARIYRDRC
jgi:multicomponent Na+:H+ antiporter subunit E